MKTQVRSIQVKPRPTPEPPPKTEPKPDPLSPLSFPERLLRGTAVCVAILMCMFAAQQVNAPSDSLLSRMVSMDLDESLGALRFVSNLAPESVSVFWNLGAEAHDAPSDAALSHAFSAAEPWLIYGAGAVRATAAGEVMSVQGDMIRIRHASGLETLYGGLSAIRVREGDWVDAGAELGEAAALVFELRSQGRALDPAQYLR